jgi:hypothetical protein
MKNVTSSLQAALPFATFTITSKGYCIYIILNLKFKYSKAISLMVETTTAVLLNMSVVQNL